MNDETRPMDPTRYTGKHFHSVPKQADKGQCNEVSNSLDSTKTRYSLWKDNYASPGFLDTLLSFSRLAVMFKSWQISSYHVYNLLDFMTAKLSCPCCSFRADSANWSWNSPYNLEQG